MHLNSLSAQSVFQVLNISFYLFLFKLGSRALGLYEKWYRIVSFSMAKNQHDHL